MLGKICIHYPKKKKTSVCRIVLRASIIRIKDQNSLWGCAGLHGGLVGIWFLMNNGLLEISKDAPIWLVGPGNINTNPLGGFYGITLLMMMLSYNLYKYKNKIFNFKNDKYNQS